MLKKVAGKTRQRPPPLPSPELSGKCELTEAAGVRLLDLGLLKKGLEAAQGCGHASLTLCELQTSVKQDLCCLLGLICRECRKLTAFSSSRYYRDQKNYRTNLEIFTAVAEESYSSLVKYMEKERNLSRLDLKLSGKVTMILDIQDSLSHPQEPAETEVEAMLGQPTTQTESESRSQPSSQKDSEKSSQPSQHKNSDRSSQPSLLKDSTGTGVFQPSLLKSQARSEPASSEVVTPKEETPEIRIKEEPVGEETEFLTVQVDPLESQFGEEEGNSSSTLEGDSSLTQAADPGGGGDGANAETLAASLQDLMGAACLDMFSTMQLIQNSYRVHPNTPVMGGSVTPWPPAKHIATSANLFIRTTCEKFGLPPGVYDYHRANGLRSVLVVKPEGGDYDSILKFFILTGNNSRRRTRPCSLGTGSSSSRGPAAQEDQAAHRLLSELRTSNGSASSSSSSSSLSKAGKRPQGSPADEERNNSTGASKRKKKKKSEVRGGSSSAHPSSYTKRTPLSIFANLYTIRLKEQNPNISQTAIGATVIEKWTKITDQEKEMYREAVVDEDLFDALLKSQNKFTPFYEALERR